MDSRNKSQQNITSIYGFNAVKPLAVLLSLICFLLLAFIENRGAYMGIIFLPLSFFVVSLCFNFRKNIKGLGGFIICMAYIFRFTLFPVIIVLGEYRCDVDLSMIEPFFNQACVIMIIEMVAVFLLLSFYSRRFHKTTRCATSVKCESSSKIEKICDSRFLKIVIGLFLLFNAFMYALYPQLFTLYWRIIFLRGDAVERLNALNHLISSIPGYLYYPFKLSAELLRYLIVIILVVKVNKNPKTIKQNWLLTLLITLSAFIILSSEQINSIIITISVVYYMLLKYHKYDRAIVITGLIAFFVIACFAFISIANVSDLGSLGRVIDNYFNGPLNTAIAIHMKNNHNFGLSNFVKDFLNAIPIVGKRLGTVTVNDYYGKLYTIPGAIMPMAGYGFYYCGYLGCWLPAALVVCTVNMFDQLYLQKMKPEYKMILTVCVIHTAICIFMYNLCIYFATWIYTFAPLLIMYGIDNRKIYMRENTMNSVTVLYSESK